MLMTRIIEKKFWQILSNFYCILTVAGSIDFQSIPKENFVVVGGTGLQKNMIYHIKSPVVEGHGQMALWDGNNMIPVDPSAAC